MDLFVYILSSRIREEEFCNQDVINEKEKGYEELEKKY